MDEANIYQLFSKKRLSDTKLLFEGKGVNIENKFGHPIVGFEGCYILLTCNFLPYPFSPPISGTSGFDYRSYEVDYGAMKGRCAITELKRSYNNRVDKFPFSHIDLAHMMKYISDYFDDFKAYKPAYDVFEQHPQMSIEEPRDLDDAKTQI